MKNLIVTTLTTCLFKIVDPRTVLFEIVHKLSKQGVRVEIKVKGGRL